MHTIQYRISLIYFPLLLTTTVRDDQIIDTHVRYTHVYYAGAFTLRVMLSIAPP